MQHPADQADNGHRGDLLALGGGAVEDAENVGTGDRETEVAEELVGVLVGA